jgi:hypothetical protein
VDIPAIGIDIRAAKAVEIKRFFTRFLPLRMGAGSPRFVSGPFGIQVDGPTRRHFAAAALARAFFFS